MPSIKHAFVVELAMNALNANTHIGMRVRQWPCQSRAMGVTKVAIQPVGEGNSKVTVRFSLNGQVAGG
jgi:hypothetical protein